MLLVVVHWAVRMITFVVAGAVFGIAAGEIGRRRPPTFDMVGSLKTRNAAAFAHINDPDTRSIHGQFMLRHFMPRPSIAEQAAPFDAEKRTS